MAGPLPVASARLPAAVAAGPVRPVPFPLHLWPETRKAAWKSWLGVQIWSPEHRGMSSLELL